GLTFNQSGREMPNGGMNDAGLVVEVMWLDSSVFPPRDARPVVSELQWIQYQLDNFATVAEATAHAADVRVERGYAKVHYLACDRTGACAAFEHIGGKLVVTAGDKLPVKALTNHTYADSLAFWKQHASAPPAGRGSLERFARAASLAGAARSAQPADLTARAFGILDSVRQGDMSQWNIVYDPVALTVSFRTHKNGRIKRVV